MKQPIHNVNHVKTNVLLAPKAKQVQDNMLMFKRSILSKNNHVNLNLIKKKVEREKLQGRLLILRNQNKWESFRDNKVKIIN